MTGELNLTPLLQLQRAAAAQGLTMAVLPRSRTGRTPIRKGMTPGPVFNAGADFIWQVIGDPRNIVAFLEMAGVAIGAYLAMRGSRSIRLESGDIEVEVKSSNDADRALVVFRALQRKNDASGPGRR